MLSSCILGGLPPPWIFLCASFFFLFCLAGAVCDPLLSRCSREAGRCARSAALCSLQGVQGVGLGNALETRRLMRHLQDAPRASVLPVVMYAKARVHYLRKTLPALCAGMGLQEEGVGSLDCLLACLFAL